MSTINYFEQTRGFAIPEDYLQNLSKVEAIRVCTASDYLLAQKKPIPSYLRLSNVELIALNKTLALIMNIEEFASYYGFHFKDYTGHHNYADRKGKVFALVDRRTGNVACVYSTKSAIRKYLNRLK